MVFDVNKAVCDSVVAYCEADIACLIHKTFISLIITQAVP